MATHSLMQAAGLLGVNKTTLQNWLAQGCPAVERADRDRGLVWKLHLGDIMRWRVERAVADAVAEYGATGEQMSEKEASRRRAVAQMTIAEIEADERKRTVVSVADVAADTANFAQELKKGFQNASHKIAKRAAAMTSPVEIEDLCQGEMNRAFQSARAELRSLWERTGTPDADRA